MSDNHILYPNSHRINQMLTQVTLLVYCLSCLDSSLLKKPDSVFSGMALKIHTQNDHLEWIPAFIYAMLFLTGIKVTVSLSFSAINLRWAAATFLFTPTQICAHEALRKHYLRFGLHRYKNWSLQRQRDIKLETSPSMNQ